MYTVLSGSGALVHWCHSRNGHDRLRVRSPHATERRLAPAAEPPAWTATPIADSIIIEATAP